MLSRLKRSAGRTGSAVRHPHRRRSRLTPILALALDLTVIFCGLSAMVTGAAAEWKLPQMLGTDSEGRVTYRHLPMDERFRNPVLEDMEAEFQERARRLIVAQTGKRVPAGNTYFENEKRTYGYLMAQVLGGREGAIRDLQVEDAQADEWHRHTSGIDFFAAFTLKHQTRKYFYFGELLEPEYRQRMERGARLWTEQDPFRRHHYAFQKAGDGWGPNVKDSWVDVRSTENLYLMRVTSVYLFAEASGNQAVAEQYKNEIRRYAATLYRVGMGEWDSENYHGHSISPLCNLYDFARDEEVRLLAKACLDWVFAAGAVKYYRGGFNGPSKRDYNHVQPFGGSAANMLWLHFGDCPVHNEHWESDEIHLITSAYRPPPAVIHLARKRLADPLELLATKPHYSATTSGDATSPPEYFETSWLGHSFLMGSLASGTSEDGGDVSGFKILIASEERGADAVQGVPGPDPAFVGSPQYQSGKVSAANRVAQHRRVALWLVKDGKSPWTWVIPDAIEVVRSSDITFLKGDRTWVALQPLGASPVTVNQSLTTQIAEGKKPRFPGHKVLSARGQADRFCGIAIEVGDQQTHGDFAAFQRAVRTADVDRSRLDEGAVQYTASDGTSLGLHWADDPRQLGVWRNGTRHDWDAHQQYLYRARDADGVAAPIHAPRGAGTLYVEAGGTAFGCRVTGDGQVEFRNGSPIEVRRSLEPDRSTSD